MAEIARNNGLISSFGGLKREHNVLENPLYEEFKKLKSIEIDKVDFDPRLLR